ncbi:MAG TPA: MFS transporter [Gemmatimonadota bacterium]|nr:MFS transporter [Gemmatimonadota bacterium]
MTATPVCPPVEPVVADRGRGVRRGAFTAALAIAVLHGVNDAYASFLHPLLPRLMSRLDLTISDAAVLTTTLAVSAALAQPLFGHLSDLRGRRILIAAGPAATGAFLSLMGLASGFGTLVLLLVLGGLGSAAFHPAAAATAARVTAGPGSGLRHAVFSFGGAAGYAAGPLLAVLVVGWRGLEGLWVAMLPAFVLAGALWFALPADPVRDRLAGRPRPDAADGRRPALSHRAGALFAGPIALVFGISALTAFVQRVFLTMEPIIMAAAGKSEIAGAAALTVYLAAQAGGTLGGGWLADRVDRRNLLVGITLLAFPAYFLALWLPAGGAPSLVFVALAGALGMAVLPPIVVIAQEAAPGRAALNSGIVMGLAWATGSIGVLGAGVLGDMLGARAAALVCTPVVLVATGLALHPALAGYRRPMGV